MAGCECKDRTEINITPTHIREAEELTGEGGSDCFTSSRHQLHNNEARAFNLLRYRTEDDAPFFRPSLAQSYQSATVPAGPEGCERVTRLALRTNLQWLAHCALLGLSGLAVFKAISLYKNRQPVDQ